MRNVDKVEEDYKVIAKKNQQRMLADPFELIMRSMWRSVENHTDMNDLGEAREIARSLAEHFYSYRTS